MPATALTKVQLGYEVAAWGTPVAATAKLMGVTEANVKVVDKVVQIIAPGSFAPASTSADVAQSGSANIAGALSYQDINYYLHGLFGHITPGGAGPYTYTYAAPLATVPTLHPFSMEFGMTGGVYLMSGALLTKIDIKIATDDVWRVTSNWVGELVTTVAFAGLSDRVVELIRSADTVITMDAVAGAIGATPLTATVISAELSIDTQRHLKSYVSSVNPLTYGEDRWKGTLKITGEYNALQKAVIDALITPATSKVQKQFRIKATSGATFAQLDFCGTLINGVELFKDRDGNAIVETTWSGEYNTTYGNWLAALITNAIATLP